MTDTLMHANGFERLDARCLSMLRHWDNLRAGRTVPGRVEINPADIPQFLSRICILERPRAGTVRIRLSGASLSKRMGMELRGMPFRALFDIDDRAKALDAAETAITTPAISILSLDLQRQFGARHEGQLLILPLADTRGTLNRAIALYSEAVVTTALDDLRGRFRISEVWSHDIPEKADLPGLASARALGDAPKAKLVMPRKTRAPKGPALARVEARRMEHHARPVFQVIEGGKA
ncbi:PAS domain-containing protein [Gymnodinialimonas hymeniacidonis]|uniref:PAS domain-containing protein n=1 Tax=Gymnodinialimonas hymeniacidonis TaxID=3126508 RepID=UPI0034C61ACB